MRELFWIDEPDVLAIHERLLGLNGGAAGVRDEGLLRPALARPRQRFAYAEVPDIVDMAMAYTAGIVGHHAFVDGNKRTGFVVGVLFLELNGRRFTASEEDATQAVLALAAGKLDEAGFAAWLRANSRVQRRARR